MDVQTIDQQYSQLQSASQQVYQELKELAAKLQAEANNGNQNAREWVLDLKEVALAIQAEQQQMVNLLQAIHGFVANQTQPNPASSAQPGFMQQFGMGAAPGQQGTGQQGTGQQGTGQQGTGGGFSGFLNSGLGRAVQMGLGFGLGEDIINRIF